jgi:precorrin-6A/cobalt-precorrin-6A reductase
MILLLGGTASTSPLALQLAEAGFRVLVSTATDVPLDVPCHARIERRSGPLDDAGLAALIADRRLQAIVDATHPYAAEVHDRARRMAAAAGIRYVRLARPSVIDPADPNVELAADHDDAARRAFGHSRPVLLTTGSKHLAPYVAAARSTGLLLVVRVLDHANSLAACRRVGIADEHVLAGRGPFTVEENRRHIERFGIGVLVTKDSGPEGGTTEKLEAARRENCRVVVVGRPTLDDAESFTEIETLVNSMVDLTEG